MVPAQAIIEVARFRKLNDIKYKEIFIELMTIEESFTKKKK